MTLGMVAVVDDEEIVIKPVARLLRRLFNKEKLDYEIMASRSPAQALQKFESRPGELAVVISDIMMEPMNGLDFLQSVKSSCPDTLLIVLTGYADQETFNALNEQLELFSYQEKPWDNEQFGRTVKNALNLFRRKKLLSRYVPEEIVEQVLMHPDDKVLAGTELVATILFLDIRDSTALFSHETMEPQKALQHLNTYFEGLLAVVKKYGGILDKFMGDGFMALFGVPYPSEFPTRDAQNAVLAAIEMRETVHALNQQHPEFPLTIGIGISTGPVIAGNIGSQQRANYTVLGSDVNIAARLEKAARPFKDGIFISPSSYEYAQSLVQVQLHESLIDKKNRSMPAYQVVGRL